jgi:predicted dehydrogenase
MAFALGLIGCGGMGRRHIRGMEKLRKAGQMRFELAAVCDLFPASSEQAAQLASELLGRTPQQFATFEEMQRAVHLDALIVTTTPETHVEVGTKALASGVHVMMEKPIALTVRQGVMLVNAAAAAGRKLAVAENYRRDPINRLAKALIEAGAVGKPYLAVQSSSSAGEFVIITPWRHLRNRGGIVVDMGVHYTDILEFLLGDIEQVFGMNTVVDIQRRDAQGVLHPADAEDMSVGVARFRNGAIANLLLNMAGRGESHFTRTVYGMGGTLAIPGDRTGQPLRLTLRRDGKDEIVPDDALLELAPHFALDEVTAALFGGERLTHYEMEWADIDANLLGIEQVDFVDAIMHDREPEVTGAQGLRSLALMMGFLESERVGRAVIAEEMLSGSTRVYEAEIENTVEPPRRAAHKDHGGKGT